MRSRTVLALLSEVLPSNTLASCPGHLPNSEAHQEVALGVSGALLPLDWLSATSAYGEDLQPKLWSESSFSSGSNWRCVAADVLLDLDRRELGRGRGSVELACWLAVFQCECGRVHHDS